MSHRITYLELPTLPPKFKARCQCGFVTANHLSHQGVEDDLYRHQQDVEKLRAALGTRTPTLKTTHAYYLERANDPEASEHDRALWQQLADEIGKRLGDGQSRWAEPDALL